MCFLKLLLTAPHTTVSQPFTSFLSQFHKAHTDPPGSRSHSFPEASRHSSVPQSSVIDPKFLPQSLSRSLHSSTLRSTNFLVRFNGSSDPQSCPRLVAAQSSHSLLTVPHLPRAPHKPTLATVPHPVPGGHVQAATVPSHSSTRLLSRFHTIPHAGRYTLDDTLPGQLRHSVPRHFLYGSRRRPSRSLSSRHVFIQRLSSSVCHAVSVMVPHSPHRSLAESLR